MITRATKRAASTFRCVHIQSLPYLRSLLVIAPQIDIPKAIAMHNAMANAHIHRLAHMISASRRL